MQYIITLHNSLIEQRNLTYLVHRNERENYFRPVKSQHYIAAFLMAPRIFNLNYICIYILSSDILHIIRDVKSKETPKLNTPIFTF